MAVRTQDIGQMVSSVQTDAESLNQTVGDVMTFLWDIENRLGTAQEQLSPVAEAIRSYNAGKATTLKPRTPTAQASRTIQTTRTRSRTKPVTTPTTPATKTAPTSKTTQLPLRQVITDHAINQGGEFMVDDLVDLLKPRYDGDVQRTRAAIAATLRAAEFSKAGDGRWRVSAQKG